MRTCNSKAFKREAVAVLANEIWLFYKLALLVVGAPILRALLSGVFLRPLIVGNTCIDLLVRIYSSIAALHLLPTDTTESPGSHIKRGEQLLKP